MLTPHDNQTYSVQVWSGTPGFHVFTILSTFKGPRQVLDFFYYINQFLEFMFFPKSVLNFCSPDNKNLFKLMFTKFFSKNVCVCLSKTPIPFAPETIWTSCVGALAITDTNTLLAHWCINMCKRAADNY